MCAVLDPASEPCHELPGAIGQEPKGQEPKGQERAKGAMRSAAAHSRDLFCCVNRVEVISSE
jgi:hypothetical protein